MKATMGLNCSPTPRFLLLLLLRLLLRLRLTPRPRLRPRLRPCLRPRLRPRVPLGLLLCVSQSVELDANLYKNRPNLKCLCMWSGEGCLIGDGDHGCQFWPQSGSDLPQMRQIKWSRSYFTTFWLQNVVISCASS